MFKENVTDMVGLYLDPPERAVVPCVDEPSQIQALDPDPARAAAQEGPRRHLVLETRLRHDDR